MPKKPFPEKREEKPSPATHFVHPRQGRAPKNSGGSKRVKQLSPCGSHQTGEAKAFEVAFSLRSTYRRCFALMAWGLQSWVQAECSTSVGDLRFHEMQVLLCASFLLEGGGLNFWIEKKPTGSHILETNSGPDLKFPLRTRKSADF